MKPHPFIIATLLLPGIALAEEGLEKHRQGAEEVAVEQDELGADVHQLVMEQTIPQVIALLDEVKVIMTEATDLLVEHDTGGQTLAAQTEVIEKIHEAAKERQKQSGSGSCPSGGAMMDMMERMMGKQPGQGQQPGEGEGEGQGEGPSETGGQGQTGDSNTANSGQNGASDAFREERRVPKAAGTAGRALPPEFGPALEANNRGMETLPRQ